MLATEVVQGHSGPRVSRRLLLAASPLLVPSRPAAAASPVARGMALLARGDVAGSLSAFDAALALDERSRPYLWQRGIALYYGERFADGAAQFRGDVAVNPDDTEEALWALLCEAQLVGFEAAQQKLLAVGLDRRPVLRAAYAVFAGTAPLTALREAGAGGEHDAFYAALYEALYDEARGETQAARVAMLAACAAPYAAGGDFMAAVARTHVKLRGWDSPGAV